MRRADADHVPMHALRRARAGELSPLEVQALEAHQQSCGECRAKSQRLEEELADFSAHVSFDEFAQGLERAATRARPSRPQLGRRVGAVGIAIAAGLVLLIAVPRVLEAVESPRGFNRLKGSAVELDLRIAASDGTQRSASATAPEPLAPGDRVRIGYRAGPHRFVAALSVDAEGTVSPLYPERGQSLPVEPGESLHYLPDSLEFTGEGPERVIVLLSDEPLSVEDVRVKVERAFERAGGELGKLEPLDLSGTQLHRTLLKP